MPRNPTILLSVLISSLWSLGYAYPDIEELMDEIDHSNSDHSSTIYKYSSKLHKCKKSSKIGRPPYWTIKRSKKLIKTLESLQRHTNCDFEVTAETLRRRLRLRCSLSSIFFSIRKELNRNGYYWRNPTNFKDLTASGFQSRLSWCQQYLQKHITFWKNSLFLDEKKFNPTNSRDRRIHEARCRVRGICRKKGQALLFTRPSQHDQASQTTKVIAGFQFSCPRPLVLFETYKKFNSKYFVEMMLKMKKKHGVRRIVCDFHKAHTSKYTRTALAENGMELIFLPKRSPDLSPLDFCCWHKIETTMSKYKGGDESMKRWLTRLKRTSHRAINKTYVLSVLESFKTRLEKCIDRNGNRFSE